MTWADYEQEVFCECQRIFRDSTVIKNTHIKGVHSNRQRQIDVLIRNTSIDNIETSIVVDAKHYATKVDIKDVESFIGMLKDVNVDKGILVSEHGFTKSAINRAHLGENNIEIDILNLGELSLFQSTGAIPYAGSYGIILSSPFGWIADGKCTGISPVTLYQRGLSLDEALQKKEWMYLQFWKKDESIKNVKQLIDYQNDNILTMDNKANIEIQETDIILRKTRIRKYPTIEITGFKDFEDFILFGVLYCPDNVISRNIGKLKYILNSAIPVKINQQTTNLPTHQS
ncbi:restriction endonuclease [uncultured Alistipes sp.]|uniref:restriction endonuclease n=1 Tax=uncultured Alistipes sp. TaxID=538949 RepID=UPI002585F31E|nr:restriction endonuclease [uncultured Alistipes sp.]